MKNSLIWGFACIIMTVLAACTKADMIDDENGSKDRISFAAFTAQQTDYDNIASDGNEAKATRAALGEQITKMDFAVFKLTDGKYSLYKKIEQENSASGFGSIALQNVAYGEYAVVAVGSKCSVHATINSPEDINFGGKVAETFVAYLPLTVNASTSASQTLEMNRCTSKFTLWVTDEQPEGLKSMEFQIGNGATSFSAVTGLAKAADEVARTSVIDISGNSGLTDRMYSFQTFLPATESEIIVVANALDASGNAVFSQGFPDAPMKVNRQTIYKGEFYGKGYDVAVKLNDEWEPEMVIEF
ncbi:MAG: FimB/Mfa2 family fimbrial subunit [Bacteroidaceae bacterium]|nr:FimB/Mfa2 family fimbrial subunit [Bacteroidaceae bacterium]